MKTSDIRKDGTKASATYENYINPHKLPPVEPLEKSKEDPDEEFFIRAHQAFELWFSQILEELEFVRSKLSANPVPESEMPIITGHIRRAAGIFNLVKEHLPLLETLSSTSFFDFRKNLSGAGGIESFRFREIEWLLGLRDEDLLTYLQNVKENTKDISRAERDYDSLKRYVQQAETWIERVNPNSKKTRVALTKRVKDISKNGTLRKWVFEWLNRTPFPSPGGQAEPGPEYADIFTKRREDTSDSSWFFCERKRCAIVFVLQFAEQPLLTWPASLLEGLLELDQAFLGWRERHIGMVTRVLGGGRVSTMGQQLSGIPYLGGTLHMRAFPEILDAHTFLLGTKEAEAIYKGDEWKHYRFVTEPPKDIFSKSSLL